MGSQQMYLCYKGGWREEWEEFCPQIAKQHNKAKNYNPIITVSYEGASLNPGNLEGEGKNLDRFPEASCGRQLTT